MGAKPLREIEIELLPGLLQGLESRNYVCPRVLQVTGQVEVSARPS